MNEPDPTAGLSQSTLDSIRRARLGYTPRRDDRVALAGRYVVAYPFGSYRVPSFPGVAVWREKGLLDDVTINGRTYYVLSSKAEQIRATLWPDSGRELAYRASRRVAMFHVKHRCAAILLTNEKWERCALRGRWHWLHESPDRVYWGTPWWAPLLRHSEWEVCWTVRRRKRRRST